jgi:hypothetical protein
MPDGSSAGWPYDQALQASVPALVPLLQGGLTKTQLSWKMSDHYPLWVEFSV